jgi:putative glutamine amidotransferase
MEKRFKKTNFMKPIIGVSANISPPDDDKRSFSKGVALHYIQEHYLSWIEAGGGTPVILAPTGNLDDSLGLVARLDGLIIVGGVDVDPSLYDEPNTHSLGCNLVRDQFEIAVIRAAAARECPTLGICRGVQVLNVAMGGSLHQDIPTDFPAALKHNRWEDGKEAFHTMQLTGASVLDDIFGAGDIRINSSHHQSVKKPGKGLRIVARSEDGVVEAIVADNARCLVGVQWHPERMQDDPVQLALARWFVGQCQAG